MGALLGALLTALLATGCGLLGAPGLEVTIRNRSTAPALIEMREFDLVTGEAGAALADASELAPATSTTLRLHPPDTDSWALLVNGMPAVTAYGLAEMERAMPGDEPVVFAVSVVDGALEISAGRGTPQGGATAAPAPD